MNSVLFSKADSIATLSFNRAQARNAFNPELISSFTDYLVNIEQDPNVKVIIISAQGEHFSAGADLKWMQASINYTQQQNIADAQAIAKMMYSLNYCSKPTICSIQGSAFGGAVGLVASCDIAVAASNATFCLPEVKLGLAPAVICPYVINAIGETYARRYMLTGETFNANKAFQIGLVHEVENNLENLAKTTNMLAKTIVNNEPRAITATKQLILELAHSNINQQQDACNAQLIAKLRVTAAAQEKIQDFFKTRPNKQD